MSTQRTTRDARDALLRRLIDDAALFPPARETMDAAVAGHVRHRRGPHGWIQGRFLCPASRLDDLATSLPDDAPRWPVGVIADGPGRGGDWTAGVRADLDRSASLHERTDGRAWVEVVEVRLPEDDPTAVPDRVAVLREAGVAGGAGPDVEVFLEVPRGPGWREHIPQVVAAIADARRASPDRSADLGAKFRCGGTEVDAFPSTDQVAAFLAACVEHGVPFKLTAGLHHPHPVVEEGTRFPMFGFLNLYAATLLLADGSIGRAEVGTVVDERDPGAVTLDGHGLHWRDRSVDPATIAAARGALIRGHGSCSFDEPVDDLVALGVLGDPATR